jgi:hypothetical protein
MSTHANLKDILNKVNFWLEKDTVPKGQAILVTVAGFPHNLWASNLAEVEALGDKLIEQGARLKERVKELREGKTPVCSGTGTDGCWSSRLRLILVWMDPQFPTDAIANLAKLLEITKEDASNIWVYVGGGDHEFVMPEGFDLKAKSPSYQRRGDYVNCGPLHFRYSSQGEIVRNRGFDSTQKCC